MKKNRGAAGPDGVTIEDFAAHLEEELGQLQKDLASWTYKPQPVRRVEIVKPGNTGVRLLGIPSIRDRVVQATLKAILEPMLEPLFSERSYGFRPGRSPEQAVKVALEEVKSGKKYVADIDLEKFFDRVNHDRLIARLGTVIADKRILRLVGATLRSGVLDKGLVSATHEGTIQGSPLSPLLSNLVLDELDRELEKRGLSFCRFADDCNIFVGSQKAAERVMESVSKFITKRLKLKVNQAKSKATHSNKVKFLGATIINKTVAVSKEAMKRAMTKVAELTLRGTHLPLDKAIATINRWYVGWANYYKMTQYPAQLQAIEAHLRRRLRCRLIIQSKRRRYLAGKLRSMGVKNKAITRDVFGNKGPWALSISGSMHKAYPPEWFVSQGLKTFSNKELDHWFGVKTWVRLP